MMRRLISVQPNQQVWMRRQRTMLIAYIYSIELFFKQNWLYSRGNIYFIYFLLSRNLSLFFLWTVMAGQGPLTVVLLNTKPPNWGAKKLLTFCNSEQGDLGRISGVTLTLEFTTKKYISSIGACLPVTYIIDGGGGYERRVAHLTVM